MSITLIPLGGQNPAHQTVTDSGDYIAVIAPTSINPTITFSGPSVFNLDGVMTALAAYTIEAINGAVLNINGLASAVSQANITISDISTVAISTGISALSTLHAVFSGVGGTLSFAPGLLSVLDSVPTVTGFAVGNHLDLGSAFLPGEQAVYSAANGILSLQTAAGGVLGTVKLVGSYLPTSFTVTANTLGQAEIDLACFLRGTLIQTPDGEVEVERLRSGDLVMTGLGQAVPITAVRLRSLDGDQETSWRAQPICIMAGALGPNAPARDLFVSPDHAMYLDGVLVPASLLQNGQTVFQTKVSGTIDYFHVEVDPHAILIAEGALTESYLDIGNRNHFSTSNTVTLFPATDPKTWEDACAPLVLIGPALETIRRKVRARMQACLKLAPPRLCRVA